MQLEVQGTHKIALAQALLGYIERAALDLRAMQLTATGAWQLHLSPPTSASVKSALLAELRALPAVTALQELSLSAAAPELPAAFARFCAHSPAMSELLSRSAKLAQHTAPLLIEGETGSGKEWLARACHAASPRANKPFMALNCGALPDNVAETELFGYAAGAFLAGPGTSAPSAKRGLLELASGGSLLLDEIGEMSAHLQTKLLRVLEDGVFRRVGDDNEVVVDVRFICTSQQPLAELVQAGRLRKDLSYRLNVLHLRVPPLRERRADILPLAEQFLADFASKCQRPAPRMDSTLREFFWVYPWPGNVRQLHNALMQAASLHEGLELGADALDLPPLTPASSQPAASLDASQCTSLDDAVKHVEQQLLRHLYPLYPSTRQLAKRLGVSHTAIANKLRDYGISKQAAHPQPLATP
ncbi:MAG: sigma 54-interacting transcriptional regulator [Aeromonas sp.]